MKVLLLITLLIFSLQARKIDLYMGAGAYVQSQPYKGANTLILPTPVIFFDNSVFYVRWTRVGLYFLGDASGDVSWGFSLTAQPRAFGYKASDSTSLVGMDERKTSWEGGLSFAVDAKNTYIEILYLHDMLNNSNGEIFRTEIGFKKHLGAFYFVPSLMAIWHSDAFNDYYYGVQQHEENALLKRSYYNSKAGIDMAAQTYINIDISEHWSSLINLRCDYLSPQITSSPIVQDSFMYSGMVSVIYSFNLYKNDD